VSGHFLSNPPGHLHPLTPAPPQKARDGVFEDCPRPRGHAPRGQKSLSFTLASQVLSSNTFLLKTTIADICTRAGSGRVGSGRVRSGWVGSVGLCRVGRVRSGQVRSVQVRSGRVESSRIGSGRVGSSQVARANPGRVLVMVGVLGLGL